MLIKSANGTVKESGKHKVDKKSATIETLEKRIEALEKALSLKGGG
jgi:hypothetical protein